MVAPSRAALRHLFATLVAAGLVVLAAAMVTGGANIVRGYGPAIHPAAEITPNSLPRSDDDQQPPAAGASSQPDDAGPSHAGPGTVAVVAEPVTVRPDQHRAPERSAGAAARRPAPAAVGSVDGRAPPEPGIA